MLVLSRKANETIYIGDNIRITVVAVAGNRVKIGIDAADNNRILRGELKQHESNGKTLESLESARGSAVAPA